MDNNPQSADWWRVPALAAWALLLAAGLSPDTAFTLLRDIGRVTTMNALVNNSWLVTFALCAYLGVFVSARCREGGDSGVEAGDKGVQAGLLGLVAFMPFPLENLPEILEVPSPQVRWLLLGTAVSKSVLWTYLSLLILRYYLWGGSAVLRRMPTFLSGGRHGGRSDGTAAESKETRVSRKPDPDGSPDE